MAWFRKKGTVAIVEAEQWDGRDELFVPRGEHGSTTARRGDWIVKDKDGNPKDVVREADWTSQYEDSPHPRTVKAQRRRARREREAAAERGAEVEERDALDQDDNEQEDAEMADESGTESKHADADERTGPGEKPVSLPEDDRGSTETDEQDNSDDARGGVVRPEGEEEEPTRRGA
jgi:hypothetical protein